MNVVVTFLIVLLVLVLALPTYSSVRAKFWPSGSINDTPANAFFFTLLLICIGGIIPLAIIAAVLTALIALVT